MVGLSVQRSEEFSESVARGKLSFEKRKISKDKYPSIFSRQMETIVFTILQMVLATRAFFKIKEKKCKSYFREHALSYTSTKLS